MNAIRELYTNAGLVTEDGYVKVNDKLWIASGPYLMTDYIPSNIPTLEELQEIISKSEDLINIQESCGLDSLDQIRISYFPWVKSSTLSNGLVWTLRIKNGNASLDNPRNTHWVIPIRRSL